MLKRLSMAGALAPVLALMIGLAAGPAQAQSDGGLFGNIFKPQPPAHEAATGGIDNSELVIRLDRLENAVRQLTGQVEQLQFRNQQLEQQLRRGGEDPAAARAAPGSAGSAATAAPRPSASVGGKRSDAFDPNAVPAAPGAPQPLGSAGSAASTLPPRADVPRPGAPSAAGQVAALPSAAGGPRELYDSGVAQIQRQDYAGAEQSFRSVIDGHPNDRLVPDATFMLGESLFLRQNYGDASAAFLDVSTKYPNFTRAPEALLRLGQSLAAFGEKEAACATLLQVDRKYPRAPSPVRQSVEREQKRIGC